MKIKDIITEAFNQPYELQWDDHFGPAEIHARAYDRQGQYIDINFVPVKPNIVDVEFSKMDSYDLTGDQDAPRVLATVLEAFKRYLQGNQPKMFIFSGKGEGRGSLYQRMITRYVGQFGYKQFDTNKLSAQARQQLAGGGTNLFVLRKSTTLDEDARVLKKQELDELRGVKQDLSNTDYGTLLQQHGFTQLGRGAYGQVWQHPKFNYVLKTFQKKDLAYQSWVATCLKHKDNPHLPKFVSAQIINLPNDMCAIRMEKLTPINQSLHKVVSYSNAIVGDANYEWTGKIDNFDELEYGVYQTHEYPGIAQFADQHPKYLEALWLVIQLVKAGKGHDDLTYNNCMMRGNELVITDPLSL